MQEGMKRTGNKEAGMRRVRARMVEDEEEAAGGHKECKVEERGGRQRRGGGVGRRMGQSDKNRQERG